MLVEKYKPKNIEEVIGNKSQIREIEIWLKNPEKALFLYGKIGCGKSLVVELLAKKHSFELIKSHADEKRGYKELKNILESAKQQSLVQKKKLIVIDDLELIDSTKGIIEIIKTIPTILIGNPYDSSLRRFCKLVKFNSIRSEQIEKFLREICLKEKIKFDQRALTQLSKSCDGDIRSALNDLEILMKSVTIKSVTNLTPRFRERDIFNTLKIIFKTNDIKNVQNALADSDKPPDEIISWLEENIPKEYEDPEEIFEAYNYLSKNLSTQDMIYGVSLSKKQIYRKFTRYDFPRFFRRKKLESLTEKLSRHFHASKKKTSEYVNLLSLIMNDNLAKKLSLDEKEIELLDQIKNNFSPAKR